MSKLDQHRIERPGADKELRDLQRRFTTISRGYERAQADRKFLGPMRATILLVLLAASVALVIALALLIGVVLV